ncbi:MAG: MBL fold metallo-hydrolase [Sporomusaceae bacterium]|nr:MBL fold metallo-hydrolase [Sporomusaceae bacterium]
MKVQLLRHATLLVTINGKRILVDPMLGIAGVMPPIANSPNNHRNPLVELTIQLDFEQDIDGVLLTHTHRDHFDDAAAEQIPLNKTILCQPEDEEKLKKLGFLKIYPISDRLCWEGIIVQRTGGQHGTGEIGTQMAPVSGYILQAEGELSVYIAGDSIYCEDVSNALAMYEPNVIIVNAGGARFTVGDTITMTAEDVMQVCEKAPKSTIIAVHMEAINHCLESRISLRTRLEQEGVMNQVCIPEDGELLTFLKK